MNLSDIKSANGGRAANDWLASIKEFLGMPDNTNHGLENQFASWLPYSAFKREEKLFINRDSLCFMLEVLPQSGADERMVEVFVSLYSSCPAGTGVQFNLLASPHIYDLMRTYGNLRVEDAEQIEHAAKWGRPARNSNLFRTLARVRASHFLNAAQTSLTTGFTYLLRNYRLVFSVSLPWSGADQRRVEEALSLREGMITTLKAASLPSRVCDATDLINWCAPLTNPQYLQTAIPTRFRYDNGREIRDQIVDFDTIQEATPHGLVFSKPDGQPPLEMRCFSIKSFPERFPLWMMGSLVGDLMQPALQYSTPFLISMGVHVIDPHLAKTLVTANHVRATQNAESKMAKIMPDTQKKWQDWSMVADTIDAGGRLVSMYHQIAIYGPQERMTQAEELTKAIWRARGFELNADIFMHRQALLASLPMTLSPAFHTDLAKMRRVTRKTVGNAIHMAPVIGEWRGTRTPTMIFGGRRGQIVALDLYDNDLGNYNGAVIGAPGSGKSVFLNELAWSYRGTGAKVWVLDLGRSMEKLCRKANGQYIEFRPDARVCLNPFSTVSEERLTEHGMEGGIKEDIDMLWPAIAKMCSMSSRLEEVQYKAIQAMILKLYGQYGKDMTITALRDAFREGTLEELGLVQDQRIRDLAVMLNPFSKGGQYERFFEGRTNIDFTNNLVVIENEELKRRPDLHAVINILLMYRITGEMYLTRDHKKILIIDELKQQLGEVGADDPIKAAVVEEAARRARKYGGSLITATQSADDYYGSASMEAALVCSDWMVLLRQKEESIELLQKKGRLVMDDGKKRLLTSLRTEAGAYSELYINSPVGEGVVRLVLDPATHLLFSNKLEDNKPIDELRAQGYSIDEAISMVLRQRGLVK